MSNPATRIAMWSGPRTVSTALMRAWENRPDTVVSDEPLYAFYLHRTALAHPGRDTIIASQPTDWRVVLAQQTGAPLPPGIAIGYAKHMTHHLLPEVDRAALAPLRHAHLIRDPRELLASYTRVRAEPTLADLGLRQQAEIFEAFGGPVPAARRPAAGPARAARRTLPAVLLAAARLPYFPPFHPGRSRCFRSSMSATATSPPPPAPRSSEPVFRDRVQLTFAARGSCTR